MDKETKVTKLGKWGRFELVLLLGQGGMGDVYKAYDPQLKRYIALKILRYEDPEVLKRFLREAHAQAQVDHMHVCKIYESGEYEGRPYIAMQYIEGQTLKDLSDDLSLEEKIRIIKEVSLGLHAAHRQGLIHRDVKPANIMVQPTEEGHWKPFVMDFGIAREQEAPELTTTGMVIGTPHYISPELARGKQKILDRRSDIYSMGVTLYELICGDVPFHGDTPVEVLMKVLQKDPLPLRKMNPRIPVDIETIVMKCLEKDPNCRYSSAKDLAEDLQRYLDGDPIKARPATITYRIKRKLIKYKWPVLFIGSSFIIIVILSGLWLRAKWTASKRAVISQQLGQEVEKIDSIIRYAHLLPLHNISREKRLIKERIKKIEAKVEEFGKIGFGPGHYAIGRGYLALQDYSKAKKHLEKAWNSGYQVPMVALERGRVLGELYLLESEKANRIYNKELRDARIKEIENQFREPSVQLLRQSGQVENESWEYIEALIGFFEKRYDDALLKLNKAIQRGRKEEPWLYEAKILEGNIFLAKGMEPNNNKEAFQYFSKAEDAYQHVVKIGESDVRGYIGLGRILEQRMMITFNSREGDFNPLVKEAIGYCEKALQIEPNKTDVYAMKSSVYRWFGRSLMISGKNPFQSFDLSINAAENAIKLQPDNFEAFTIIGITNRLKGQHKMSLGQNPSREFQTAVLSFKQAIIINPNYVMAYNGMGNVFIRRAQYEMNQGLDPHISLTKSISNFEKALAINPGLVNLYNGLAGALWIQSSVKMSQGKDPRPFIARAIKNLNNAITINRGVAHYHSNLGFVYMDLGRYEVSNGFNPNETVNKAIACFERAVEINPKGNELYLGLVSVRLIQTQYDYMKGKNCSKWVLLAHESFKRGIAVNPNDILIYIRMAATHLFQANYFLTNRQSPLNSLLQAKKLLNMAKAINPNHYEIYVQNGKVALQKAKWAIASDKDPSLHFIEVETFLKKAEKLNPKDIHAHLMRARFNMTQAAFKISSQLPARRHIIEGLDSIKRALTINPGYGETYMLKGVLKQLFSNISTSDEEKQVYLKESRDSFKKGFKINKNLETIFSPFFKNN